MNVKFEMLVELEFRAVAPVAPCVINKVPVELATEKYVGLFGASFIIEKIALVVVVRFALNVELATYTPLEFLISNLILSLIYLAVE